MSNGRTQDQIQDRQLSVFASNATPYLQTKRGLESSCYFMKASSKHMAVEPALDNQLRTSPDDIQCILSFSNACWNTFTNQASSKHMAVEPALDNQLRTSPDDIQCCQSPSEADSGTSSLFFTRGFTVKRLVMSFGALWSRYELMVKKGDNGQSLACHPHAAAGDRDCPRLD
nr:hypothetical protein CFP56_53275 [Quercus suber]